MQTKMKIEVIPQHILLSQTLTLDLLTIVWWPVAFWSFPETVKDVHMHSDISSQLYNNSTLVSLEVVYKKIKIKIEQSFAPMHKINGHYHTVNFHSWNGLPMFLYRNISHMNICDGSRIQWTCLIPSKRPIIPLDEYASNIIYLPPNSSISVHCKTVGLVEKHAAKFEMVSDREFSLCTFGGNMQSMCRLWGVLSQWWQEWEFPATLQLKMKKRICA